MIMREVNKMDDSNCVDVCLLSNEKIQTSENHTNIKDYLPFVLIIPLISFTVFTYIFSVSHSCIPTVIDTIWYENEIIYEVNVPKFYDSNNDGIGDLQGLVNKFDYFEKNHIQTILLQSSIFNVSEQIIELWDRQYGNFQTSDLLTFDSHIGNENDWNQLRELLNTKDMHLVIDLPLSSAVNLAYSPCVRNKTDFGCIYTKAYKRMPLNFSDKEIIAEAEFRIRFWFEKRKIDGIRVDLPLELDSNTQSYIISIKTIHRWKNLIQNIEQSTKTNLLLLFDIPNDLQSIVSEKLIDEEINYANSVSLFLEKQHLSSFWQIKPYRDSVRLGLLDVLSQRILFTVGMLIGGTPIIVSGDELGVKQRYNSWMPWSLDVHDDNDDLDSIETDVKTQESMFENENESLLMFFRRLAMLRKNEAFQNGISKYGRDSTRNIIWFIREAPTHKQTFIIIIHMNRFQDEAIHISLQTLTRQTIPEQISKEYQWPKQYLSNSESNKLIIYPGSINIFSW